MNPFEVLELPPKMDLDLGELERASLQRSRECHPDFHHDANPQKHAAVVARSADINDAYRALSDPWTRARILIERGQTGTIERSKDLCPMFLMEMMDQTETIAKATDEERASLREQLESRVTKSLEQLHALVIDKRWEEAAVLFHQSKYHRKAVGDLRNLP